MMPEDEDRRYELSGHMGESPIGEPWSTDGGVRSSRCRKNTASSRGAGLGSSAAGPVGSGILRAPPARRTERLTPFICALSNDALRRLFCTAVNSRPALRRTASPRYLTRGPYFLSIFWMWLISQSRMVVNASKTTVLSPPRYRVRNSATFSMNRRCASF